jgi:hypothetical protein
MVVIERVGVSWKDASFAVVALLVSWAASLVICPQVGAKSVCRSKAAITAAIPSLAPITVSIEDDDCEFEDDSEPCGLLDVRLASSPSLTLPPITPPQTVCFSVLTPAQHPLRC